MRELNPTDEINLVYDSKLLSEKSLADLFIFCQKLTIKPIDVRDIFTQCETIEEKNLINDYENELKTIDSERVIVVCRDILSWLKPIYELGTYTDLDTVIDTSEITTIEVDKPLLLPIGSNEKDEHEDFIALNNNIIAVVDSEAALPLIQKIQRDIHQACSQHEKDHSYCEKLLSIEESEFSAFKLETNILHKYSKGKSMQDARKDVIKFCSDNESFCNHLLPTLQKNQDSILLVARLAFGAQIQQMQAKSAELMMDVLSFTEKNISQINNDDQLQAIVKKKIERNMNWFELNAPTLQRISELLSLNDDKLTTCIREGYRELFIRDSVICTTGPINIKYSLFGNEIMLKNEILEKVAPYSFAHYGLNVLFSANDSLEFLKDEFELDAKGKSDASWLADGKTLMLEDDKSIEQAVETLQRATQRYKAYEEYSYLKENRSGFFKTVNVEENKGFDRESNLTMQNSC
jgi:glucosyltransferase Lgt1/2/3